MHVDIWWFIGSQLDTGPENLPVLDVPMNGSAIVPWRYHFNTGEISSSPEIGTYFDANRRLK